MTPPISRSFWNSPVGVERHGPAAHLDLPAAERGVAGPQDVAQPAQGDPVGRQPLLREAQRHLLVQDPETLDLAHLRDGLEGALHDVGEALQLPVAVLVPGDRQEARPGPGGVAHDGRLPRVGVELRHPEPLFDEPPQVREDRRVGELGDAVHPDERRAHQEPGIAQDAVLRGLSEIELGRPHCRGGGNRGWEVVNHGGPLARCRAGAQALDRSAHLFGADRDLHLFQARARHREHEPRGVAEVLDELDRPGALGQIPDLVQPEHDVVEDLPGLRDPLLQLHVDVGDVGPADGPDGLHVLVLGDHGFDAPGYPVLDPLGVHAGPGGDHERRDHRDVGILALGHVEVPHDAPEDRAHERDPGDLALLGEVAGEIAGLRDQGRVVDVGHGRSASG